MRRITGGTAGPSYGHDERSGAQRPPPGAILGAAIGFVVGEVFQILESTWDDDVFRPATVQIEIPSLNHRFENNATESAEGVTVFSGHGGKYQVAWDWRVFA
jgi:hypothetical protein